ncbi:nucleoside diphosphate kinase [Thermosporothrix hazakensis]|jgi:nucleoside-diphosphate kinase|uniref:Nucleoside diphosphate kinase n=2 Tax=Thermosporothrix TaxID=768650 RepID=A0A326UDS7_THEHA|nr:nucleoside-diphosphate kinase [Thermosporothrix hazakensis]PZW36001.1 nucleoside diphosphate kinase [Thermosporothrix hazakensis]BBH88468.1 nucleoside-diphosphate kinase [Thermosporothrix sp. COM3]GCE46654.1 nucleoside-diphosphate kinase [Thermosporothrix hazakensis]
MERTLVLLKPDAIQRDLVGEILSRFERKGLKIVGLKMMQLSDELLNEHYSHLVGRDFFPEVKSFMQLTPVIALCLEGTDCVNTVRALCGVTKAREAAPGTIRGEFGMSVQANLIHCSDSLETAQVEVPRFFKAEELFEYPDALINYVYSAREQE